LNTINTALPTVYIAYRRNLNEPLAQLLGSALSNLGFDTYLEAEASPIGMVRAACLAQITARSCFIAVVTPTALNGIQASGDWLGEQIQAAKTAATVRGIGTVGKRSIALVSPHVRPDPIGFDHVLMLDYRQFAETMLKLAALLAGQPLSGAVQVPEGPIMAQIFFESAFVRAGNDTEGRIEDYTEALRHDPAFAEAYGRRAGNYDLLDQPEKALADCNAALAHKPYLDTALINRGVLHLRRDAPRDAIQDYNVVLRMNPKQAMAYFNRGVAHALLGEDAQAEADFTEAITLMNQQGQASTGSAHYRRALVRAKLGRFAEAIADYDQTLQQQPSFTEAYYNRGLAHAETDLKKAVEDWSEAIRLAPDFAQAYYNRARVLIEWGDLNAALADLTQVVALSGDTAEANALRQQINHLRYMAGKQGGSPN
jgi:tetratricopeptide (TPR) repeat protein